MGLYRGSLDVLLVVIALNALYHDGKNIVERGGDTKLPAVLGDHAVEHADLGLAVVHQHILSHGGIVVAHVVDEVLQVGVHKLIRIEGAALRRCDCAAFADDAAEQLHTVLVVRNLNYLESHKRADGVDGAVDDDLAPDVRPVVIVELRKAAARGEHLGQILARRIDDRVVRHGAEVDKKTLDLGADAAAGSLQRGAECAAADDDAVCREVLHQDVGVAEAVYQGNDDGVLAYAGHRALHGVVKLSRLGDEDDDIHDADVVGVVRGFEAVKMILGVGVDDEVKAVLGDLVHVLLVHIDKRQIGAALSQITGEHAAGCAAANYCYFHFILSP